MAVIWRARALTDVRRIVRYIAADNPVLAGDSVVLFPHRGRLGRQAGTRELVVSPPYIIVHRVGVQDGVTIPRVWHAAQER